MPQNVALVEMCLSVLERNGITESIVRMKSPGFTEIEAMGWDLLTPDGRITILGELLEINIKYLVRMLT